MEKTTGNKSIGASTLVKTACFVALIVVCSWISIPIGGVAITLQTAAIGLCGVCLGARRGVAAVGIYLLMGMIGIPVFAGFHAGISAFFQPSGGYLISFLLIPLVTANVRRLRGRHNVLFAILYSALAHLLCYAVATGYYAIVFSVPLSAALSVCVLPFLIGDAVKTVAVAYVGVRLFTIHNH